ncbi:MAG TPA: agmatinase family protein [Chloroflexota bacterium]|nr:agmatinase family protein [Chloroflexota bacterium]
MKREDLDGTRAMEREAAWPTERAEELARLALEYGLPSADSIRDRSIPLFNRTTWGWGQGGQFMGAPFLEDMRNLGGQDVAIVGVPLDCGTTFRSGTRWGPQAIRRISALQSGYNPSLGVDLVESLTMVDVGDVSVIPANIEKSFDQIDRAVSYIHERAIFPVVLGGDHSIGYPDIRGLAPHAAGNIGIIHFDRHADISERNLDERMHGSPWFHATNIPNAPPTNLVQIGIGGWTQPREWFSTGRKRQTTILTMEDVDQYGIERVAEYALEVAWKNASCVFLSFDIDCMDPAYAPGTGTPEPGGFLPREILRLLRLVAREGLAGLEVVEVSPPYDVADNTALLATRVIMDVLGTLVLNAKLGRLPTTEPVEPA